MGKANHRKFNTNTETYVKNPKGKNHRERERDFTIIMTIALVFSGVLELLSSIDCPPSALEGIYCLYR